MGDTTILVATDNTPEGERQAFGISASFGQHEAHWRTIFNGQRNCSLNHLKPVISDDHIELEEK